MLTIYFLALRASYKTDGTIGASIGSGKKAHVLYPEKNSLTVQFYTAKLKHYAKIINLPHNKTFFFVPRQSVNTTLLKNYLNEANQEKGHPFS
jgi:hypothetical protein